MEREPKHEDEEEDPRFINRPFFDKGGHKERSLFWQPNHKKHFSKEVEDESEIFVEQ